MASLGTWPTSVGVKSARFEFRTIQRANADPYGGSEQVVDMLNDRWMCHLTLPVELFAQAAAVEAFLHSFRGQVNTVNLWHFARSAPRGTMRGTPTIASPVAQGASSLPIQAVAGETLLAGDMVGAGGMLFMAAADATANGAGLLTLSIVNRVRVALAAGAAVTWDKPTAPFRMLSHTGVLYERGITEEVQCTLGEVIS